MDVCIQRIRKKIDPIDEADPIESIRNIFLVSIPGALLLVAAGAWLVAGSALRPIHQLTGVIQQVTVQGLDQRIPIGTTDIKPLE